MVSKWPATLCTSKIRRLAKSWAIIRGPMKKASATRSLGSGAKACSRRKRFPLPGDLTRCYGRSGSAPALPHEFKKLNPFAQAPLHHCGAEGHFRHDRSDFWQPQVKAPVEFFDRVEDFGVTEVGIA